MCLVPSNDSATLAVLLVLPAPPGHDLVARLGALRRRLPDASLHVFACGRSEPMAGRLREAARSLPGLKIELSTQALPPLRMLATGATGCGRPWLLLLPPEPGPDEAERAAARWRAGPGVSLVAEDLSAPRLLHRDALLASPGTAVPGAWLRDGRGDGLSAWWRRLTGRQRRG